MAVLLVARIITAEPHWPKITDPAQLRREVTSLCKTHTSQTVPRDEWPEGIASLKPRAVVAYHDYVKVMISAGGISAQPWGYTIWADTKARPDGGITKYDSAREKD